MAFAYTTMQSFVKNTIQPHIVNVKDLLESSMLTLKEYLIDRMGDLEKRLTDFVNTTVTNLRKELTDAMNALDQKLTDALANLQKEVAEVIAAIRQEMIELKVYVLSLFDHRPEFPVGYISAYYGKLDASNTHPIINDEIYLDWYVCDGRNGTPDLRDRFIIGANGNFGNSSGTKSHNHNISVSIGGSIRGTTLTTSNLPPHTHRFSDRHTGVGAMTSDKWPGAGRTPVVSGVWVTKGDCTISTAMNYTYGDLTYHSTDSIGSGTSHTHDHSLYGTGSSGNTSNIPPCIALHYIMYKK
nr:MAG TPA: Baseplate structural protein [Caudoviricetes sp.]